MPAKSAADDTLVTVTIAFGNSEEADEVARALVEERLAVCAQIWPMRSTYRWEGKIEAAYEVLLSAKTLASALPALEAFVLERHGYQVPEIVALPVHWANAAYAGWVKDGVRPR